MPQDLNAPDDGPLQLHARAGDAAPRRSEDPDQPGLGVGRSADDLDDLALGRAARTGRTARLGRLGGLASGGDLHLAHAQAVGVRVGGGLQDAGDREARKCGLGRVQRLDLQPEGIDGLGDGGGLRARGFAPRARLALPLQMLLQP